MSHKLLQTNNYVLGITHPLYSKSTPQISQIKVYADCYENGYEEAAHKASQSAN